MCFERWVAGVPGQRRWIRLTFAGRVLTVDAHGNVTLRVSCTANATGGCPDGLALYVGGLRLMRSGRCGQPWYPSGHVREKYSRRLRASPDCGVLPRN